MKNLSHAILGSASNLLGICFLLVGYVKKTHIGEETYLDEFLVIPIIAFFLACLFSYLALRSSQIKNSEGHEKIADLAFAIGLTSIAVISIIFTFEVVK
jgi:hypothetical protein